MKTIILDFDGTIADSFESFINIVRGLTKNALPESQAEIKELKRDSLIEVAEQLGIAKYHWPLMMYRGRKQMTKMMAQITPFSDIDEVMAAVYKDGHDIYIMSSNSNENISLFLASHGMSQYVKKIYGGVGLLNKASALAKIIKSNNLKTDDVLYVGDEVRDIAAAKDHNVPVIAVSWGFNDPERLLEETPMVLVRNRPQLLKSIEAWAAE